MAFHPQNSHLYQSTSGELLLLLLVNTAEWNGKSDLFGRSDRLSFLYLPVMMGVFLRQVFALFLKNYQCTRYRILVLLFLFGLYLESNRAPFQSWACIVQQRLHCGGDINQLFLRKFYVMHHENSFFMVLFMMIILFAGSIFQWWPVLWVIWSGFFFFQGCSVLDKTPGF